MEKQQLYDIKEACKIIGCSESTFRRWKKDGKITTVQVKNKLFITQEAIDELKPQVKEQTEKLEKSNKLLVNELRRAKAENENEINKACNAFKSFLQTAENTDLEEKTKTVIAKVITDLEVLELITTD